jgi:hypothetical protein
MEYWGIDTVPNQSSADGLTLEYNWPEDLYPDIFMEIAQRFLLRVWMLGLAWRNARSSEVKFGRCEW